MQRFAAGQSDVLVATTVIEVGVDVPNASVMVICDADRFGISQLHQLRGRIGRGAHPGVCLLLTGSPEGSLARTGSTPWPGPGTVSRWPRWTWTSGARATCWARASPGSRSSLRLLRVLEDVEVITQARELAARCIAADPELTDPGLADIVTSVEERAAGDWLERS